MINDVKHEGYNQDVSLHHQCSAVSALVINISPQIAALFLAETYTYCFLNCNVLDEMGSKIDELEQSINHLKAEMGVDGAAKATPEETKPSEGTD